MTIEEKDKSETESEGEVMDDKKQLIIEYCKTPLGVVFMAADECDWETIKNSKTTFDPALLCHPTAIVTEEWESQRALMLGNDPAVVFREVTIPPLT